MGWVLYTFLWGQSKHASALLTNEGLGLWCPVPSPAPSPSLSPPPFPSLPTLFLFKHKTDLIAFALDANQSRKKLAAIATPPPKLAKPTTGAPDNPYGSRRGAPSRLRDIHRDTYIRAAHYIGKIIVHGVLEPERWIRRIEMLHVDTPSRTVERCPACTTLVGAIESKTLAEHSCTDRRFYALRPMSKEACEGCMGVLGCRCLV